MKTTTATVNLILSTYENADGTRNIQLRVQWNGRALKSLGYSVKESDWDKRTQTVNKKVPNAKVINISITKAKREVEDRVMDWNTQGIVYTAKEALYGHEIKPVGTSLMYLDIVEQMAKERGLTYSTKKSYTPTYVRICKYFGKSNWFITDLNEDNVQGLLKNLKRGGLKDSTVNATGKKIASVFNYCIKKNILPYESHPFRNYSYGSVYSESSEHRTLTEGEIALLMAHFVSEYTFDDEYDNTYYIDERNLTESYTGRQFALAIFLLGYFMNGVALVDIMSIKSEQLSVEDGYYIISGHKRRKTNEKINIVFEKKYETEILLEPFLRTAVRRNGFLFPGGLGECTDEVEFEKKRRMLNYNVNLNLHWWSDRLGIRSFSYYYCRHSAASHLANKGAKNVVIASLMGRSVAGIDTYISKLTKTEELISELNKLKN